MREQRGFGPPQPLQLAGYQGAPSVGHYAGLHPEDAPGSTDEVYNRRTLAPREQLYDDNQAKPRLPSSTRRYGTAIQQATPKGIMQVTRHKGPPPIQARASRYKTQTEEPDTLPRVKQTKPRKQKPVLVYIGSVCLLLLLGWFLISTLISLGRVALDDQHYGRPRHMEYDMDVGHGGPSHFIAENLNGHIVVIELPNNDASKAKIYSGPTLVSVGGDPALIPVTLAFPSDQQTGLLDMVINVNNGSVTFYNGRDGMFHSSPPSRS